MKKVIGYILVTILSLSVLFWILEPAKADSGWDTSYDSSGGYDFDYDFDYDYDYDSDRDYSENAISFKEHPVTVMIWQFSILGLLLGLFLWIIYLIRKENAPLKSSVPNEIELEKYNNLIQDISIEDLRQKAFEIYEKIQYAWSDFDYDTIQKYTTDELYNMYLAQLKPLKFKNQQNVMKDIEKEAVKIINVDVANNITTVEAYLKVNCYDYIINTKTNKVLRGKSKKKLQLEYIITLVKDNTKRQSVICPNCGTKVKITSRKKCKYCDAILVQNPSEYVMSKKKIINQKTL